MPSVLRILRQAICGCEWYLSLSLILVKTMLDDFFHFVGRGVIGLTFVTGPFGLPSFLGACNSPNLQYRYCVENIYEL